MAVAVAHFFEGNVDKELHVPYEQMTEGSRVMYDLVKSQHPPGTSIIHALSELVTSTDELTIFATIGQILGTEKYYVTIKPDPGSKLPTSDARHNYTTDKQAL